jgi:hypothetical protein
VGPVSASGGAVEGSTVVAPANPAAGADWSFTITAGGTLQSVTARLVTSATAANRTPQLVVTDGAGHTVALSPAAPAQPASATATYQWSATSPSQAATGATVTLPVPALTAAVGWTVATTTAGIQAGDQWSNIVIAFTDR